MSKKSVKELVLNVILDILIFLLGFVLIVFIYNNIEVKVLGNDHASFFGYSLFEVQTGSMKNEINIGDWIIVKYTDDISLNNNFNDDILNTGKKGQKKKEKSPKKPLQPNKKTGVKRQWRKTEYVR